MRVSDEFARGLLLLLLWERVYARFNWTWTKEAFLRGG